MLCSPCGKKDDLPYCANCDTTNGQLFTCKRCQIVRYCGRACQSQDWKINHKKQCIPIEERHPDVQKKPDKHLENSEICSICIESIQTKYKFTFSNCSHFFHYKCINRWLEEKQSCPLCNKILDKDDMMTCFNLAILYAETNQINCAKIHYKRSLYLLNIKKEKDPEIECLLLLKYALLFIQDFTNVKKISTKDKQYAQELIHKMLEINPKFYVGYMLLADITSNMKEKLDLYKFFIKNDKNDDKNDDKNFHPIVNYKIAIVLVELNDYKRANIYYNIALKLDKSLTSIRIKYAAALISNKKLDEAVQKLKEILVDYPNCADAQYLVKIYNKYHTW